MSEFNPDTRLAFDNNSYPELLDGDVLVPIPIDSSLLQNICNENCDSKDLLGGEKNFKNLSKLLNDIGCLNMSNKELEIVLDALNISFENLRLSISLNRFLEKRGFTTHVMYRAGAFLKFPTRFEEYEKYIEKGNGELEVMHSYLYDFGVES